MSFVLSLSSPHNVTGPILAQDGFQTVATWTMRSIKKMTVDGGGGPICKGVGKYDQDACETLETTLLNGRPRAGESAKSCGVAEAAVTVSHGA
jgi:hypothetical protein